MVDLVDLSNCVEAGNPDDICSPSCLSADGTKSGPPKARHGPIWTKPHRSILRFHFLRQLHPAMFFLLCSSSPSHFAEPNITEKPPAVINAQAFAFPPPTPRSSTWVPSVTAKFQAFIGHFVGFDSPSFTNPCDLSRFDFFFLPSDQKGLHLLKLWLIVENFPLGSRLRSRPNRIGLLNFSFIPRFTYIL